MIFWQAGDVSAAALWKSAKPNEPSVLMSTFLANTLCKLQFMPVVHEILALGSGAAVRSAERLPLIRIYSRSEGVTKATAMRKKA